MMVDEVFRVFLTCMSNLTVPSPTQVQSALGVEILS